MEKSKEVAEFQRAADAATQYLVLSKDVPEPQG